VSPSAGFMAVRSCRGEIVPQAMPKYLLLFVVDLKNPTYAFMDEVLKSRLN